MKKKFLVAAIVLIVILIAIIAIVTGKSNGKTEIKETAETPAITEAVEVSPTIESEETAAETSVEVPEIGSSNSNKYGWTVEGDAVPEVSTQQQDNQVALDIATGENETERIPISSLGNDD